MRVGGQAERIREDTWLHTGDILSTTDTKSPEARMVVIEKILYNPDLTRSFVLAPYYALRKNLYRTTASAETVRRKYLRIHTNEVRII